MSQNSVVFLLFSFSCCLMWYYIFLSSLFISVFEFSNLLLFPITHLFILIYCVFWRDTVYMWTQRTIFGLFSPATSWVLKIKLRSSALHQSASACWALLVLLLFTQFSILLMKTPKFGLCLLSHKINILI